MGHIDELHCVQYVANNLDNNINTIYDNQSSWYPYNRLKTLHVYVLGQVKGQKKLEMLEAHKKITHASFDLNTCIYLFYSLEM